MELIVVVGILSLLLFLINELFRTTTIAVQRSVQASKSIAANRVIGEQLDEDALAMVGPNADVDATSAGFIVIIQQELDNIPMPDPNTLATFPITTRSDQIVFIRNASGLRSMTPENADSYISNLGFSPVSGSGNPRALVYYGQAQRTARDGRLVGGAGATFGGASAGLDRVASDFILARQAMLFNPKDLALTASSGSDVFVSSSPGSYTHAEQVFFNSAVNGSGGPGPSARWMGFTDVTVQPYGPVTDDATPSLLYMLADDSGTLNIGTKTAAYRRTIFQNDNQRLRVNPAPDPAATDFESWAIAQTHPILTPNCSEFWIDFAADLNGNGRIDTASPTAGDTSDTRGPIVWYDFFKDGALTWDQTLPGIPNPMLDLGSKAMFIFRCEDALPEGTDPEIGTIKPRSSWPYLIRIRYRLHDTRGRLVSNNGAWAADGIDNDYDGQVDEFEEEKIPGVWHEHIIRVPRQ